MSKGDTWFVDSVHTNDLGHQAIADVFTAAFDNGGPAASAGPDQSVAWGVGFELEPAARPTPRAGPSPTGRSRWPARRR